MKADMVMADMVMQAYGVVGQCCDKWDSATPSLHPGRADTGSALQVFVKKEVSHRAPSAKLREEACVPAGRSCLGAGELLCRCWEPSAKVAR